MADTTITPKRLTLDTIYDATAGTPAANNIVATSTTDGWVVDDVEPGDRMVFIFTTDGSGTQTVTFKAGDYPPSPRKALGDKAFSSLGDSKTIAVCVEAGRFLQDDGTIRIVPADAGTTCLALILPRNG